MDRNTRRQVQRLVERVKNFLENSDEEATRLFLDESGVGKFFPSNDFTFRPNNSAIIIDEVGTAPVLSEAELLVLRNPPKGKKAGLDRPIAWLGPLPAWMHLEIRSYIVTLAIKAMDKVAHLYGGKISYEVFDRIAEDFDAAMTMWLQYMLDEKDAKMSISRVRAFLTKMVEELVQWSVVDKKYKLYPATRAVEAAIRRNWNDWSFEGNQPQAVEALRTKAETVWDMDTLDDPHRIVMYYTELSKAGANQRAHIDVGSFEDFVNDPKEPGLFPTPKRENPYKLSADQSVDSGSGEADYPELPEPPSTDTES